MCRALELAEEALIGGEIPIGAVAVYENEIIAAARNEKELRQDATAHAEILALQRAAQHLGRWRLEGVTLYCTLEPCPMCAGAIINARIPKVYFGARDSKAGACGGVVNLFEEGFNHRPELIGGILEKECGSLLTDFFRSLRNGGDEGKI